MAARSAAGGRATAEGPSLSRPQKPSAPLPNLAFIPRLFGVGLDPASRGLW